MSCVFRSLPPSKPDQPATSAKETSVLRRPLPKSRDYAPFLPFPSVHLSRGAPHSSPSSLRISHFSRLTIAITIITTCA